MNIQGIKLVTGEELVANVEAGGVRGYCIVTDPLVLRVSTGPSGLVVNFFPWTLLAEGEIRIEGPAIMARFSVPEDVINSYIQNTTGLQIVSAGGAPSILNG